MLPRPYARACGQHEKGIGMISLDKQVGNNSSPMRGYTLIEMLITIVVMGISSAIVIPSIGDAGVLRIQASVRTLVSDITFAQTDALAYQQRRAILFDVDQNSYTVADVQVTSGGNVAYEPLYMHNGPGEQYIVDFDTAGFDGATLASPDFDGNAILHFDELGGPVADGASDTAAGIGTIYIDSDLATFKINVTPFTGQVLVEKVAGLP